MATIEYLGTDTDELYSDGTEIEQEILDYAKKVKSSEYSSVFENDTRWPVFYHLSDMRENILSWYDFEPGCEVLEIGGGMGAITGLLCERAGKVTTVELTKRRASVIYERHKKCDNLNILVGNFNEMTFDKKFDYITLIGVLAYAKGFVSSGRAEDFLERIFSLLKPSGKLLIAIENRFGLKYWCGASEDHLVKSFVGINGYIGEKSIQTYSRSELDELVKSCGFASTRFYYPLPDYKFPQVIFSDDCLPNDSYSKGLAYYYIGTPSLVADENRCFREAVKNGAFPFMANSFFVECSKSEEAALSNIVFSSFTSERRPAYRTVTRIRSDKTVEKLPSCLKAMAHLDSVIENQKRFVGEGLMPYRKENGFLKMDVIDGTPLGTLLRGALIKGDIAAAKELFDKLYDCIKSSVSAENEGDTSFGFLDMTVSNCFVVDGRLCFYDQEWARKNVSARFILYRAIRYFFSDNPDIANTSALDFFGMYGFTSDELERFEQQELEFQNEVCLGDVSPVAILSAYRAEVDYDGGETARRLAVLQQQYDTISNATLWKISAPLRKILDRIKMKNTGSGKRHLVKEAFKFYRTYGFYDTLVKTKDYLGKRAIKHSRKSYPGSLADESETLESLPVLESLSSGKSIAVHVHLYYTDLLEEFCGYLDNIPYPFDLFVSVKKGEDIGSIRQRLAKIKNVQKVTAEFCENRGRDIAPLYVQFGKEIQRYSYFLHIHTKKSLYTGFEQKVWRHYSLDTLLGSEEIVRKIFGMLEDKERGIGLVFPETVDFPIIVYSWLRNRAGAAEFLGSLGMELEDGYFNYPTGSFFWAKTESLAPIFKRDLTLNNFAKEAGQTDGTLAHVLERAVAVVSRNSGYHLAIIDTADEVVRFDISLKLFGKYFSLDADKALGQLKMFDLVSFDIFDTLISRKIYAPDDTFRLIGNRIKNELGIDVDFLKVRKNAEKMSNDNKGASTSINDIYSSLPIACKELAPYSDKIKQWEIEAELDLCVPRTDMVGIFNRLQSFGKRIVLISDMYLTPDIISRLLAANGISGYEDMWISCDKGIRKDDESLWKVFFAKYDKIRTIHVGDNPTSDGQYVWDLRREQFVIMNPQWGFKLTKLYPALAETAEQDRTVEASVMLGLVIQNRLFNSPFAQNNDGQIVIDDPEDLGYVTFGPILAYYTEWLCEKTKGKRKLFLAREGHVFKQFFDLYCSIYGYDSSEGLYFLTSRRSASVASLRSSDDIRDIMLQDYSGSLSNLLKERLGFDITGKLEEREIELPKDIDSLMQQLEPYTEQILTAAEHEREGYLAYIEQTVGSFENTALIDIGYRGTIQYFLSKLLDKKIDGYYLGTLSKKRAEKLGCLCEAAFPVDSVVYETENVVIKNQRFLESLLKAPFGQLICFEQRDGTPVPLYRNDDTVPEGITKMVNGALAYAKDYWTIAKKYSLSFENCKEPSSKLMDLFLNSKTMSKGVGELFSFTDAYCSNGSYHYNSQTEEFDLKKE